ncbi:MAG: ketopantoate reductase family protein [Pseudorhodoplanes sp.]|uniref:ketopantoate reductase family protein n=1 Tax=Pseudorhodoplanes sp. TaxID=1934341 RepID=UPI003D0CA03B
MRILIMGSGGVGGVFGARLARGGADVIFVARGAHLAAMRKSGLRIEGGADPIALPEANATDDPATAGRVDMILFAVKLGDTESAARMLLPCIGPETGLISFQNGVRKDDMLRPIVGDAALVGGTSYVSAAITAPGVITQTGTMQGLAFGEFDGRRSKRVEDFHEACLAGGIQSEISPDINLVIWEKFAFLASVAGTTTSMRAPVGAIRENPMTRQFLQDLMQEIVDVGRARGVTFAPDFVEKRMSFADTLPASMIASMYHDLQSGKPLELRWLNGSVVDLGAETGVPTPLNRAVRDILILHAKGRMSV